MVADVKQDVNVNQFWQELIEAYTNNAFGDTPAERAVYFKVVGRRAPGGHPPGAVNQHPRTSTLAFCGEWVSYTLYINFGPALSKLEENMRKRGKSLSLNRNDIRDQMSQNSYWISGGDEGTHRQRFGKGQATARCWAVSLDHHPLGYIPVEDEALFNSQEDRSMGEAWNDPRMGDLYSIVKELEPKDENKKPILRL